MKHTSLYILLVLMLSFLPWGITAEAAKERNHKKFTVVVDAGHGGKDIGATDNNAREKDINLGVALQLESLIKKKLKGANVVMTRDDDTYLTLQQRADVANKAKGDLFISIHTNSVDKSNKNRKTVAGSSVYALGLHKDDNNMRVARRENSVIELEQNYEQKYSGFDPAKDESYIIFEMAQKKNLSKSIKFAEEAQNFLVKSGRKNRGVHQAGFWVLWATSMPSVLIELDFICNPNSAKFMTSEKGQKELAGAIFKAVESYFDGWKKSQGQSGFGHVAFNGNHEVDESGAGDEIVPSEVVVASAKTNSRKTVAPSMNSGNLSSLAMTKRRRRSESARKLSAQRSLETKEIPLHKEMERKGKVEVLSDDSESLNSAYDDASAKPDKKDKKAKKKEKKEKKNKEKKKKTQRSPSAHNAKIEKFVTVYKIQVLASADLLKQNNPRFCGLAPISAYKENNLYKYYYGESRDRNEIDDMLKEVKKKIPDAFVVSSMKSIEASKK